MKKIIALTLAMMLALIGTFALAEAPAETQPFALTLTDDVEVDQEAARQLLTTMGIDESSMEIADAIIALIDALEQRLTIADGGFQYDLNLNGKNAASLGGEITDDGIALACTLIPSYVLTLNSETIQGILESAMPQLGSAEQLPDEAMQALFEYLEGFMNTAMSAVAMGQPEKGDYNFNGVSFNTRTPVDVDLQTIVQALKDLEEKITSDERIASILEAANSTGMNVNTSPAEEGNLPVEFDGANDKLDVAVYTNEDENGNTGSDMYIESSIIPEGQTEPTTFVNVCITEELFQAQLNVPEQDFDAVLTFTPAESINCQLDVNTQGQYFGLNVNVAMGDDIVILSDVYVNDPENPLLRETTTIAMNGARTLTVVDSSKKTLAVESLFDEENSSSALSNLGMDVLFNGLGSALTTVTEAVPELEGIINSLMSGEAA